MTPREEQTNQRKENNRFFFPQPEYNDARQGPLKQNDNERHKKNKQKKKQQKTTNKQTRRE